MVPVFLSRACLLFRISALEMVKDAQSTGEHSFHQVGSCTFEEVRYTFPYPWLRFFLTNIRAIKTGHNKYILNVYYVIARCLARCWRYN